MKRNFHLYAQQHKKRPPQKDVVTWFHLHLSTTKKSRKPQISYIVATVLCLHKSKEVVLNQLSPAPFSPTGTRSKGLTLFNLSS